MNLFIYILNSVPYYKALPLSLSNLAEKFMYLISLWHTEVIQDAGYKSQFNGHYDMTTHIHTGEMVKIEYSMNTKGFSNVFVLISDNQLAFCESLNPQFQIIQILPLFKFSFIYIFYWYTIIIFLFLLVYYNYTL